MKSLLLPLDHVPVTIVSILLALLFVRVGITPLVDGRRSIADIVQVGMTGKKAVKLGDHSVPLPAMAELKDIELARIGHGYAGWPATCLSRLRPIQAGKDVWTVNFIHGTVRRAFVDDSPRAVSDDQFKVSP